MSEDVLLTIGRLARLIVASQRVVAFTGAGVSTESGIPDFRGIEGTWTRFNAADFTFHKFLTSPETRHLVWERFRTNPTHHAQPNPAHLAIVELEHLGKLDCVITQNVDNLHQEASNLQPTPLGHRADVVLRARGGRFCPKWCPRSSPCSYPMRRGGTLCPPLPGRAQSPATTGRRRGESQPNLAERQRPAGPQA